jgi:hypothetical protein
LNAKIFPTPCPFAVKQENLLVDNLRIGGHSTYFIKPWIFRTFSMGKGSSHKGISNPEVREPGEVAVDGPEFLHSVFDRKDCNVGVMDEVPGGMTGPYGPAQMG